MENAMPNAVNVPITGTSKTVTNAVVFTVLKQLKEYLNLPDSITIRVPSSSGMLKLCDITGKDVSTVDDVHSSMRVTVEKKQENLDTNAVILNGAWRPPLMIDRSLGLTISPVYVPTQLTINIEVKASDETTLNNMVSNMRTKFSLDGRALTHEAIIRYMIPSPVFDLVKHVWELTDKQPPYNVSLPDYLKRIDTGRLVYGTDIEAINLDLMAKETHYRITGRHEFTDPEKTEFDEGTVKWVNSFTYTVYYESPEYIRAEYPTMVHQNLLDRRFLHSVTLDDMLEGWIPPRRSQMRSERLFENRASELYPNSRKPLRIPLVDSEPYDQPNSYYTPIVIVLCTIPEDDKRTLLNLEHLDYVSIAPEILDWLKAGEYQYLTKTMGSLFRVQLLEGMTPSRVPITVDSSLTVSSLVDLDRRKVYRVVFEMINKCGLINTRGISAATEFIRAFTRIENRLVTTPALPNGRTWDNEDECADRHGLLRTVQVTDMVVFKLE